MKRIFLAALAVLMTAVLSVADAKNQTKLFKTADFTEAEITGMGDVVFTQGDAYTVRLTGDSILIAKTSVKIQKGVLRVTCDAKNMKNKKFNLKITVCAPSLSRIDFDGVGHCSNDAMLTYNNDFQLQFEGVGSVDMSIRCNDLKVSAQGVGSIDLNVDAADVTIDAGGVGSVSLNGSAQSFTKHNSGVGSISTSGLKLKK